jgi:hypothetical protein
VEPEQGQCGAVEELVSDLGELAVPDADAGELGPPLARPGRQPLAERGVGRLRWLGHITIVPQCGGLTMSVFHPDPTSLA